MESREGNKSKWIWFFLFLGIAFLIGGGIILFSRRDRKEKTESWFDLPSPSVNLSAITIPPTKKHSATVICLHGLGSKATEQKKKIKPIARKYPHIKFIFPQAPTISVSMNGGWPMPSWYDIKGNRNDIMNLKQNKEGLLKSVQQIEKIIREEVNSGISPKKIMIVGHSQGGSVALAIGLLTEHKLFGIVCLSGFLPCREEIFNWVKEGNKKIPFWLYHNYYDDIVPAQVGDQSAELLKQKGYQAEFDNLYNGDHFFRSEELEEIITKKLNSLLSE